MRRSLSLGLALTVVVAAGCIRNRDLQAELSVEAVSTGWVADDSGGPGMNKVVPTISLRLRNVSDEAIDRVQVNAIFRRADEPQSWGEHFVRAIDAEGLAPGQTTETLVLRSPRGYTGTQGAEELLRNSEFVDARVDILGRHTNRWIRIGQFPIDRALVAQ